MNDIDEWRFANRIATRADAVRRLCKIGIFAENELEQIVDSASAGVEILSDHATEMNALYRRLVSPENADLKYGSYEVSEILSFASGQAGEAESGMTGLHSMIVTLYNVIAAIADARSIRSGIKESEKRIAEANAAAERANAKKAERDENRYLNIAMLTSPMSLDEHDKYLEMSDEEQDASWVEKIDRLKTEEEADPDAFQERYIPKWFWEKSGWVTRLRQQGGTPLLYHQGDEAK
ncbi:hypothetical protein RQ479_06090 [Mesorhizobium sp. ISC25]|uniref:hypothetical protein n=1 Tax=Mesorhizobium sp. ISC25 TaxID=3077335 RepID=UPI0035E24633